MGGILGDPYNTIIMCPLQCFESIQRYGADLVQLIEDLDGGKFIQQNIESLLRAEEGRQLLAEVITQDFLLRF